VETQHRREHKAIEARQNSDKRELTIRTGSVKSGVAPFCWTWVSGFSCRVVSVDVGGNRMVRSWERVIFDQSPWMWRISRLIVAQVDSMAALSKQQPATPSTGRSPPNGSARSGVCERP